MPARFLLLSAVLLAACGSEPESTTPEETPDAAPEEPTAGAYTVYDAVEATPSLSTLAELVAAAGGAGLRDTATTVTLFAPTNEALEALPAGTLDALRSDPAALRAFLDAHTLPTRMPSVDVFAEIAFDTPAGTELTVDTDGETVTARGPGGAGRVVEPDLDAANGVVHAVDAVLATPPPL